MPDSPPFDASRVRMKLDPPLSASFQYIQGKNVKEEYYAGRTLPAIGRGKSQLWFARSGSQSTNISEQLFFNDSILGSLNVTGSSALFSADIGKIETRFSYIYDGFTLGLTNLDPIESDPYRDKEYMDTVKYLKNPDSIQFPVVLEDPAAVDPYDYNGVIEPIVIRGRVAGTSTFIGDALDPEPTGVRGALGGNMVEEPYYRYTSLSQFFNTDSSNRNYPWGWVVDKRIYSCFYQWLPSYAYTADDNTTIEPWIDTNLNEDLFSGINQSGMRKYLETRVTASMEDRPRVDSKTLSCGFDYEDCEFGTDSIAFGGLIK
jgi:hypothetical protein